MKGQRILVSILAIGLGLLLTLVAGLALAQGPGAEGEVGIQAALGTAITYQGRLTDGGSPANGSYDLRFILYDAEMSGSQVGSTVNKDDVAVTDGLFTVELDFGSGIFTGDARYLEIGVRPGASTGVYTTLSPRQALTAAPYALALPGLWTQQNATSPNLIGGFSGNSVTAGVEGATIGGGGASGSINQVTANYATIGGGERNTSSGFRSTVGGGLSNTASGPYATVGGGGYDNASGWAATVGGGDANAASGQWATVPGGLRNTAQGDYSFAAGRRAKANHDGAFVWADSTDADFASTANDQFAVQANGGVVFSTGGASFQINGGDAWTSANDGSGSGLDADKLDGQDGPHYLDWNNLTNVPAGFADGVDDTGAGGSGWSLTGNAGTNPTTNFLGTTDNQALELRVNNARALRLEPNADSPNFIGGLSVNWVTVGVVGATIGGGGAPSDAWGGPYPNRVTDDYGTVGGGQENQAGDNAGATDDAPYSTVAGGLGNTASGATGFDGGAATVGGGAWNTASGGGATISGGIWNLASGNEATISGGLENTASGEQATVGGGGGNTAKGDHATVGGGLLNHADALTVTIGGGEYISVTGQAATVAGGSWITVTGDYAAVGGGGHNTASGIVATIGGGGENTASGDGATIGGGIGNVVTASLSTIGGGAGNIASGDYTIVSGGLGNTASGGGASIGGGAFNEASADYATVGGGGYNTASGAGAVIAGGGGLSPWSFSVITNTASAAFSTIGGGGFNTADAPYATVGGGEFNTASGYDATVGGGNWNEASGGGATVGGGDSNIASSDRATVGGGSVNTASGWAATVPGGSGNTAQGNNSFAAGNRAKANHDGAFVWADSTEADVESQRDDQFLVRAYGGSRFEDGTGLWVELSYLTTMPINTSTGAYLSGGGFWTNASDRNAKENFAPVDGQEVLARLARVPISTWNHKTEESCVRHIGPTAQDFYAAFGLGDSDKAISTLDADGVALTAIQGLYELVQEKNGQITALEAEVSTLHQQNTDLEARVAALEQAVGASPSSPSNLPGGWWPLFLGGLVMAVGVVVQRRHPGGGR